MQVLRAEVVDPTWHDYCPYVAIKQVSIPAGSDEALISSQLDDLLQEALLHAFLQQSIGDWGHRVVQAKAAIVDRASGPPKFTSIALEYCAGGSLQRWLTRVMRNGPRADGTPRLPLMTRLAVAKLLLQGVAHMHSRNLVHMDLKPGNVLLRKRVSDGGQWQDVSVAVGDLGRVRFVGERVRAPVGTPGYMAPEVACANGMAPTAAQAANDIWSIGIVLLNLIGCAAVSALSMREVQAAFQDLPAFWASIGYSSLVCEPGYKELMTSCINEDASQRPSAEDLLEQVSNLEHVPWGQPTTPAPPLQQVHPLSYSHMCASAVLMAAAVLSEGHVRILAVLQARGGCLNGRQTPLHRPRTCVHHVAMACTGVHLHPCQRAQPLRMLRHGSCRLHSLLHMQPQQMLQLSRCRLPSPSYRQLL
jgi:serine/threonine protein kinase